MRDALFAMFNLESQRLEVCATGYGKRPKTATLFVVAANTLPSAIIGVMNLLPLPKWSRPLDAWLLL